MIQLYSLDFYKKNKGGWDTSLNVVQQRNAIFAI